MSMRYKGSRLSATANTPTSLTASGAWTLQQQMQANGTSTWPFVRDPQFNYVTMLLHGDGSAGANVAAGAGATPTVTAFDTDASTNNFNITINGDARSNNFNPYQAGYYSNYFDGTTGQYLNAPANTVFNFGTGDFTVEAWVYPTSTSGTRPIIEIRTTGGANGFALLSQSGATTLNVYTNGGFVGASSNSLTTNQWNHVALTRSGNTWTYWINGVSGGSFTNSSTQSDGGTTGPKIGGSTTSGEIWIGYISNARITKGAALYTTTFTPSTTPLTTTVSSGTVSLLTSQSNRFIDNSVNAFTITVNGSPQVSPAQPFTLPSSVATYGSGYFDGSGDYLTLPVNSAFDLGTNACCVESWVYLTSTSAIYMFATSSNVNGQTRPNFYARYDQLQLDYFGNVIIQANVSVPQNSWNHVVFTRASSSGAWRIFLNGVLQAYNATGSQNLLQTGAAQLINSLNGSTTASGYVTDLRVVNGSVPSAYVTSSTTIGAQIFTPPTAPLTAITNTSVLTTQYNGGGNNSGFKDSSQNNFVITRNGNTTQGTFTPYETNWSNYFGGSDYITLSSAPIAATGAFTFECWVFVTGTASSQAIYGQYLGANGGRFNMFWNDVANKFTLSIATTSYDSASTYTPNAWYHIAWVRDGSNNLSLYVNGVRDFTTTGVSTSLYTGNPIIAARAAGATPYTGYISNMRITNTVVYSGTSFTVPTTPLTNISGTTLLTCQSNCFVDNETTPLTFTISGSPSVQSFSPFANPTAYNPATISGSAYFDGTGDYLTAPNNSAFDFGSGNFTIECWCYSLVTTGGADQIILGKYTGSFGSSSFSMGQNNTTLTMGFYTGGSSYFIMTSSVALQGRVWNHIAVTRSGNSWYMFLNGVQVASTTQNVTVILTTTPLYVGGEPYYNQMFTGYISDLRLVKGTALYTTAFTPPTAPLTPTASTSLLLSNTNAAILDQSMMNNLETVGNAQISTSVVKYGTASMYFDGSGDGLFARSTPDSAFGTGDFTVEFWINLAANLGSFVKIIELGTSGNCLTIETQSSTNVLTVTNLTSTVYLTSSSALTTGSWIHVAVTRASGTLRIFQNGTQTGSVANTVDFPNAGGIYIGQSNTGQAMNGYLDEIRITRGVARYTTTFTPPTQAFPNG